MVQVDVFYKTLANKTVVQQKAYTYPMLLGKSKMWDGTKTKLDPSSYQ